MRTGDTTVEASRVQRRALANKTADERAQMALEMSELVRQLVMDGIQSRNPELTQQESTFQLIERLHGSEMAIAASGGSSDGG